MSADEQRRRQILEAAERLLRHYGPSKTTMAEIAREASLGVGTVYLEFSSKDSILEELSQLRHSSLLDAMRTAAGVGSSPAARLRGVLDAKIHWLLSMADEGAHAYELVHCGKPAMQSAQAWFRAEELRLLVDLLAEGVRTGAFDMADPEAGAHTLLRAYASFSPPLLFHLCRDHLRAHLDALHDLVFHGLLHRDARP